MPKPSMRIKSNIVVGKSGKPKGVLLSMNEFKKVSRMLEDVIDVHWIEDHKHEEKEAVSWQKAKRQLEKDGLI